MDNIVYSLTSLSTNTTTDDAVVVESFLLHVGFVDPAKKNQQLTFEMIDTERSATQ
jgi:hypothetical protein